MAEALVREVKTSLPEQLTTKLAAVRTKAAREGKMILPETA